jgi:hypothetical protein
MKANPAPFSRVMRRRPVMGLGLGCAMMLALASCTGPVETRVVAVPVALPSAAATPVLTQRVAGPVDWRDADVSAGAWGWALRGGASEASFGVAGRGPSLQVACAAAGAMVQVFVPNVQGPSVAIVTSSARREFAAQGWAQGGAQGVSVTLPAQDRFLDAMVFTRGRFAVETAGLRLILPADPAVGRVLEDCRRAR